MSRSGAAGVRAGVDIGGTFVKVGLVRGREILAREKFETASASTPRKMEEAVVGSVHRLARAARRRLDGVGVGVPGLVDYPSGVVRRCVNLKGWDRVPLQRRLNRRLRLPVAVDNDVKAMTLAEWRYGAGKGARNLICLTLGTGVGGGLVLDGVLYRGRGGPSAEIGHLSLEPTGARCPCGGRGCLERYVGNQDLLREVRRRLRAGQKSRLTRILEGRLDRLTPESIDRACEQGDPFAQRIWAEAGERIGWVLANLVNLLNPDRIVIGGGIAQAGRWIFEPIRKTVRERAMQGLARVPIVPAAMGPDAGLIGASLLIGDRAE